MKSRMLKVLCLALIGLSMAAAAVSLLTRNMAAARAQDGEELKGTIDGRGAVSEMNGRPVAVIELFTSEGCSSCPPADSNLQRISKMKPTSDGTVIPLSFHVDYWNYLGWEDPFSREAFSERQRDYARGSKQQGVYTPQMVVNGMYAFNGSDEALTDKAIQLSLSRPVTHVVDVSVSKSKTGESFVMSYAVTLAEAEAEPVVEADSDFLMNIAVASESESVNVVRGENGGRELAHVWVVKKFDVRTLSGGKGRIEFDAALVISGHTRVVAYVQSKASREITGAAAVEL